MPKPDSLPGPLDLLVLKILSRRPRLHGYAIMSAIQNMSGDVRHAEEGSLIPLCIVWRRLAGFVPNGLPKKPDAAPALYELTTAGKKQLAAEESR
jgi:PadR family transcriptional regulator PadR